MSTLKNHTDETNYKFSYSDTKILQKDNNYSNLKTHESLPIKSNQNTINFRTGTYINNNIYKKLIQQINKIIQIRHEKIL